jgi:uncharacterized membrane protein YfcA
MPETWTIILPGFGIGLLIGLTGMGGGSITTALLIVIVGVAPVTAVGTDLLFAAVTKVAGAAVHARNRTVDWRIVGLLAGGSLPATVVTIWLLSRTPLGSPGVGRGISLIIGAALVVSAVALLLRSRWPVGSPSRDETDRVGLKRRALTTALGLVLGVLVTVSSVGAGAIALAMLVFLYPNLPAARLVGSDIAHAVPLTLLAGLGHWYLGSIDWTLLGALLAGSLPGIWVGSHLAGRVPERILMPLLGGMLLIVGLRLLVR